MLVVEVLAEDYALGAALDGPRLAEALRCCTARVADVPPGSWDHAEQTAAARGGFGLLVLDGLLVRRVGRERLFGSELLGPGDVLRPWTHDGEGAAINTETFWRVLEPSRLAVLDLRFAHRAGPYPEIAVELMDRVMQRSRRLAVHMAFAHSTRVERRLLMLLWDLADRWGTVRPGGVRVELPLTHALLADLVVAQRPAVTLGLKALSDKGVLERDGRAWNLLGEPPAEWADDPRVLSAVPAAR